MADQLLLTLVDHAKPFKGLWRLYLQEGSVYQACHSQGHPLVPVGDEGPVHCQRFPSQREACAFVGALQFNGWSIDDQSEQCRTFRSACAL